MSAWNISNLWRDSMMWKQSVHNRIRGQSGLCAIWSVCNRICAQSDLCAIRTVCNRVRLLMQCCFRSSPSSIKSVCNRVYVRSSCLIFSFNYYYYFIYCRYWKCYLELFRIRILGIFLFQHAMTNYDKFGNYCHSRSMAWLTW